MPLFYYSTYYPKLYKLVVMFLLTIWVFLGSTIFANAKTLYFGVYGSDKVSQMIARYDPVMQELANKISKDVGEKITLELKVYKKYEEGFNAFINGEVDFVRFGPASYILAKDNKPGVELLVMETKKGEKYFDGIIFVREDSPIQSLADINGKSFAFGNINSTIGRYLVQAELIDAGIYSNNISKFDYLGSHSKVAFAVGVGDYDVGSVKESTYKKNKKKRNLREIARFKNITKPWIARAGLDSKVKTVIKNALKSLSSESYKILKVSSLVDTDDETYDFVRKKMKQSEKFMMKK